MASNRSAHSSVGPPPAPPTNATTIDDLTNALVQLRQWAGSPSYSEIARRVQTFRTQRGKGGRNQPPGRVTIYDCFRAGRSRLDVNLLCDIVVVLGAPQETSTWRAAYAQVEGLAVASEIVPVKQGAPDARAHYTGRTQLLQEVCTSDASAIAVVGMPGVGKTEFVRQAASHLIQQGRWRRYLYVNLRGYDESLPPAAPSAVLQELHRAAGGSTRETRGIELAAIGRRLHTILESNPTIIVFDNAANQAQIAPLISACTAAKVFVTSRRKLGRGIPQYQLDPLSEAAALELLKRLAPEAPFDSELRDSKRLIELCGCLPLNLVMMGARLQENRGWTIADQVARLEEVPPEEMVRPTFMSSYRALPAQVAEVFRAISRIPSDTSSGEAIAALTGDGLSLVRKSIDQLAVECLISVNSEGRAGMHDLVRAFGVQMTRDIDPLSGVNEANRRLISYFAAAANKACRLLNLSPLVNVPIPELADQELIANIQDVPTARQWLIDETQTAINLSLLAIEANTTSAMAEVAQLTLAINPWLEADGRSFEAELLNTHISGLANDPLTRTAALTSLGRALGNLGSFERSYQILTKAIEGTHGAARAAALNELAVAAWSTGAIAEAIAVHEETIELARASSEPALIGTYLSDFADALRFHGEIARARKLLHEALTYAREASDRDLEGRIHLYLVNIETYVENFAQAEVEISKAIAIFDELGNRHWLARTCRMLGETNDMQGNPEAAEKYFLEALEHARRMSLRSTEGEVLAFYGGLLARNNRGHEALEVLDQASQIAAELSAHWIIVDAKNGVGEALFSLSRLEEAEEMFRQVEILAAKQQDIYERSRAMLGLARCAEAEAKLDEAREHYLAVADLLEHVDDGSLSKKWRGVADQLGKGAPLHSARGN
jgi:tetratricopeptide (TPR) repeat protein